MALCERIFNDIRDTIRKPHPGNISNDKRQNICTVAFILPIKRNNLFLENFRSKLQRSVIDEINYFDGTLNLNLSWGFQDQNTSSVRLRVPRRDLLARFQDDESRGNRRRRQTMLHRCLNLELGLIKILQADTQLGISQMLGKTTVCKRTLSSSISLYLIILMVQLLLTLFCICKN